MPNSMGLLGLPLYSTQAIQDQEYYYELSYSSEVDGGQYAYDAEGNEIYIYPDGTQVAVAIAEEQEEIEIPTNSSINTNNSNSNINRKPRSLSATATEFTPNNNS